MNSEDLKIKNMESQINLQVAKANNVSSSFGICSECGLIHPPLKPGEKCPNAPIKIDGGEINLSNFFRDLKNICSSQIEIKKIKNPDILFKKITIEIAKFLENYKEDI